MHYLIKETVDAVRLAEKEAQDIIDTAVANANGKKVQMRQKAEAYREEALKSAQIEAEKQMQSTIHKCEEYNNSKAKDVEEKVEILKSGAAKNVDKAVDAVISALV